MKKPQGPSYRPTTQSMQNQQAVISLNDRLYNNAKAVFEQKSSLLTKYQMSFLEDVISHTLSAQTSYNIQKEA